MSTQRSKKPANRAWTNQRRAKISFAEVLSSANRRAHEQANRRSGKRGLKSIRAAIAAIQLDEDETDSVEWTTRLMRWLLALILLPPCGVTSWTFVSRLSRATVDQGFWHTAEFWYFATGALLMVGWFWSGLAQRLFLYLYVLGHELTHAVFVLLFRGKVTDFHVSHEGGYITTNKTNLLIALSPYFVPFWSVICVAIYGVLRFSTELRPQLDLAFYAAMGVTWTFHMAWTLWMIPRDQPDLKENGTFLSLVVIYFANTMVLVALLCAALDSPLRNAQEFAMDWFRNAATSGDIVLRWLTRAISDLRATGKF